MKTAARRATWSFLFLAGTSVSGVSSGLVAQTEGAPARLSFSHDIRPLLSDRCYHCHGPDAQDRKAGLRLDVADGAQGAYRARDGRAALTPGSLDKSEIWRRITSRDEGERMPPPASHKQALDAEELARIRRWILEGAEYEAHWAFVAPRASAAPVLPGDSWSRGAIDRFVLRRMRRAGLAPSEVADKRSLIRRLSFDLTGLPPTREEIRDFLSDTSSGAYDALVERLLARPQYGEHMARAWLDLVRFADTNGVHHDHYRDLTPYRDWVIRAFASNMPFDRFVVDQIAGDLHEEPTREQLVASGFHRLHLIIDVGTALPEESHVRNVVDRVSALGTAFLGLTLQCAVCHDHKYDPIAQRDFFGLYAFFNNFDGAPETGGRRGTDFRRGLQKPYINLTTDAQERELGDKEAELAVLRELVGTLARKREREGKGKAKLEGDVERAARQERARAAEKKRLDARVAALVKARDALLMKIPAAMVMRERAEPRPAHILIRGAYDRPGAEVARSTPSFLPPLRAAGGSDVVPTRMDLARWLVSPEHPLTARVAVNRIWQRFFGVGLVKTSEDFGTQGEAPSHPALLDTLARDFARDWDVKALVRRIVRSATYRQSSRATPAAFRADPENRLLARGARFRMDAEQIRDQFLATSGLLNPRMFGKSVKPPQPAGIWKSVTLPSSFPRVYQADRGEAIYRRSVYTFWKRALPPPQMTLFGAPTRESCVARRERTNTPLQALVLWNEPEYLKAARKLALDTMRAVPDGRARAARLYETITSQLPDASELRALLATRADMAALYARKPELAGALCEGVALEAGEERASLAAWTVVASTIYNLDVSKTRQ